MFTRWHRLVRILSSFTLARSPNSCSMSTVNLGNTIVSNLVDEYVLVLSPLASLSHGLLGTKNRLPAHYAKPLLRSAQHSVFAWRVRFQPACGRYPGPLNRIERSVRNDISCFLVW